MRIPVLRSPLLVAIGLMIAIAVGPASARRPLDLATFPLEYGYGPTLDGRGSVIDPATAGEWRVTGGDLVDGRLTLDVEVRAPAISVPLESGPAVLFGSVVLRGGQGEVGAELRLRRVAAAVLSACADPDACTYAGSITLPTQLVPRVAAKHPGGGWYMVSIDLSLVRTFAQGTWLQVLPLYDEDHDPSGGTLAQPMPHSGSLVADGVFPVAQQVAWNAADRAVLDRVERLRRSVADLSSPPAITPLRVEVTADACAGGWTLASPTGDTVLDVGPGAMSEPIDIDLPLGVDWTAYVPSLSGVTFSDEAFAYGPFRATGPATVSGTLTGRAPDCTGYANGVIAWQDDAAVASPSVPPTDAP